MPPGAATDLDVCAFVKGIARDGHDVDALAVLRQPGLGHFAAVCDDGDGFEMECGFAVLG